MLSVAHTDPIEIPSFRSVIASVAPTTHSLYLPQQHDEPKTAMSPKPDEGIPPQPTESNANDVPDLPPPPNPSSDPRLSIANSDSPPNVPENDDIFKLSPRSAMKLLSGGIEALVRITGDIPPTPPPTSPTLPNMRGMAAEKALIRSNSEKNLARMRQEAEAAMSHSHPSPRRPPMMSQMSGSSGSAPQPIDGVHLRQTQSPTSPPPPSRPPEPYIIIGENSQPINLQHSAITRKFYSKKPPPIGIDEYLARIHRFCPMSTGVYLATSLYIHRLAVEEQTIPVTRRNAHRLVLAGLRVAMKALEDLSYPHSKMAKVGGVSDLELARLEISFCFLANFELVVREDTLKKHWEVLKKEQPLKLMHPNLPDLSLNRPPRNTASTEKENESN